MKFLPIILCLLCLCGCQDTGYSEIIGEYRVTENEEHVLVRETEVGVELLYLTDVSNTGDLFDSLSSGDIIKIYVVVIEESQGKQTVDVFQCKQINNKP